jgi:disulfide bond formation protein DsbB
MPKRSIEFALKNPAAAAAAAITVIGAATIGGAWFFQYGLGLSPCPLCLEQRIPYYGAIPLAALVAFAALRKASPLVLVGGLGLIALVMLTSAGLAIYHAGVEWHWWAGPQECAGQIADFGSAQDLMKRLQTTRVVRCDEAAWRFLGLSLAGYNALISLALAALAAWGMAAHGHARVGEIAGDSRA